MKRRKLKRPCIILASRWDKSAIAHDEQGAPNKYAVVRDFSKGKNGRSFFTKDEAFHLCMEFIAANGTRCNYVVYTLTPTF